MVNESEEFGANVEEKFVLPKKKNKQTKKKGLQN